MKIYKCQTVIDKRKQSQFRVLSTKNDDLRAELFDLAKIKIADPTGPIPMILGNKKGEKLKPLGNFAWLSRHLIGCDELARAFLEKLIPDAGSFFEVSLVNAPKYFIFRCEVFVDAFIPEQPPIKYNDPRYEGQDVFFFEKEKLEGLYAFRVKPPNFHVWSTFFTEKFVKAFEESKLTGIAFEEVWEG